MRISPATSVLPSAIAVAASDMDCLGLLKGGEAEVDEHEEDEDVGDGEMGCCLFVFIMFKV